MEAVLKKLSRVELLELMILQGKKIEELQAQLGMCQGQMEVKEQKILALEKELAQKEQELKDRNLEVASAGSIAEAALGVQSVFVSAQEAAEQYLYNIKERSDKQDSICQKLELEAKKRAAEMVMNTKLEIEQMKAEAESYCVRIKEEANQYCEECKNGDCENESEGSN